MVRKRVVPSKPRGLDRNSTNEPVRVRESMRDPGRADRPRGMAPINTADERKSSAAVVIDHSASFPSGQGVVRALESKTTSARAELDAPRLCVEVCSAV
jgi:hypothetical protein